MLHPALAARYEALVAAVAPRVESRLSSRVLACRVAACSQRPPRIRLAPWHLERSAFRRRSRTLAGAHACLVLADVRDFFGSVGPAAVGHALRRLGCGPRPAEEVRRFLRRLHDHGVVRGLPVGPLPSAILANAVLASLDEALEAAGVDHLRWVDDVLAGAADRAEAEAILRLLRGELAALGLELNAAKTRIVLDPATARWAGSLRVDGVRAFVG